jgi:hypothetical protein
MKRLIEEAINKFEGIMNGLKQNLNTMRIAGQPAGLLYRC